MERADYDRVRYTANMNYQEQEHHRKRRRRVQVRRVKRRRSCSCELIFRHLGRRRKTRVTLDCSVTVTPFSS